MTITLEDDLSDELKRRAMATKSTVSRLIEELLRQTLAQAPTRARAPTRQATSAGQAPTRGEMIDHLLANPLRVEDFKPLTREGIYERR